MSTYIHMTIDSKNKLAGMLTNLIRQCTIGQDTWQRAVGLECVEGDEGMIEESKNMYEDRSSRVFVLLEIRAALRGVDVTIIRGGLELSLEADIVVRELAHVGLVDTNDFSLL